MLIHSVASGRPRTAGTERGGFPTDRVGRTRDSRRRFVVHGGGARAALRGGAVVGVAQSENLKKGEASPAAPAPLRGEPGCHRPPPRPCRLRARYPGGRPRPRRHGHGDDPSRGDATGGGGSAANPDPKGARPNGPGPRPAGPRPAGRPFGSR